MIGIYIERVRPYKDQDGKVQEEIYKTKEFIPEIMIMHGKRLEFNYDKFAYFNAKTGEYHMSPEQYVAIKYAGNKEKTLILKHNDSDVEIPYVIPCKDNNLTDLYFDKNTKTYVSPFIGDCQEVLLDDVLKNPGEYYKQTSIAKGIRKAMKKENIEVR